MSEEFRVVAGLPLREYMRRYHQKPEVKAKRREYRQKPEVKAKQKEYQREYNQKYRQKPEVKAKKREYQREYQREHIFSRMLINDFIKYKSRLDSRGLLGETEAKLDYSFVENVDRVIDGGIELKVANELGVKYARKQEANKI